MLLQVSGQALENTVKLCFKTEGLYMTIIDMSSSMNQCKVSAETEYRTQLHSGDIIVSFTHFVSIFKSKVIIE